MRKLVWMLLLLPRVLVLIPLALVISALVFGTSGNTLELIERYLITWPLRRVEEEER
jgi:hypothetical protein